MSMSVYLCDPDDPEDHLCRKAAEITYRGGRYSIALTLKAVEMIAEAIFAIWGPLSLGRAGDCAPDQFFPVKEVFR
jgi:hypothetical protein